jgi:hypothetical protein
MVWNKEFIIGSVIKIIKSNYDKTWKINIFISKNIVFKNSNSFWNNEYLTLNWPSSILSMVIIYVHYVQYFYKIVISLISRTNNKTYVIHHTDCMIQYMSVVVHVNNY